MSITLECKKICIARCISAVALSVLMQFVLLTFFLLFVNFDILHPIQWITHTFNIIFSFGTWISALPLLLAICCYGIFLAKSHLAKKTYYATRFKWLICVAFRKLLFFSMHILVGFLTAWVYCSYLNIDYRSIYYKCYGTDCINSHYIFLISVGIAAGLQYFCKENLRHEPVIVFPIIQEKKIVQIRSLLYTTLYTSLFQAILPTIVLAFTYWIFAGLLNRRFAALLNVEIDESQFSLVSILINIRLLLYACILMAQIFSNMLLMQRFFCLYLTEELQFGIDKSKVIYEDEKVITLVEALSLTSVPIIQMLAAMDFYNMSKQKSTERRQELFSLTVPGAHPKNWNLISEQCLKILNDFTNELTTAVLNIPNIKQTELYTDVKPSATDVAEKVLLRQYNATHGIRKLTADISPKESPPKRKQTYISVACERINNQYDDFVEQIENFCYDAFYTIPGIFYMFGEPNGAKTVFLLNNAQTIVWILQSFANICTASLIEDQYGVVQMKLKFIINAMLKLKWQLDKLINVSLNGKKSDRNTITLRNTVKRSLYKIASSFGNYLHDFLEDPLELEEMKSFACFYEK